MINIEICREYRALQRRITIKIILASTSPYRKLLLERLKIEFSTSDPGLEETRIDNETAIEMVIRLAEAKARLIANKINAGLVIGSDQAVDCEGQILGKPLTFDRAKLQLLEMSGKCMTFHTGLCVINAETGDVQTDVIDYEVVFRNLSNDEIERYLKLDEPFNCAGSFKSEALGISLLDSMSGTDPTALVGLPLIRLSAMLRNQGVNVP